LYGHFLALQGTGNVGEQLALPGGRQVQRLPISRARPLVTIFGEFTLQRIVYGSREGPQLEAVPLDARLQLPDSKFSYRLQSWDQLVTTEQPYGQVSRIMEMILGVSQHVDSLERMSRQLATSAEEFSWSQPPPPAAEEGQILVESADGKGVPIRHAADAPPIRDQAHRPGPKPARKRMATVGVRLAGSANSFAVDAAPQADRCGLRPGWPRVAVGHESHLPAGPADGGDSRFVAHPAEACAAVSCWGGLTSQAGRVEE
jgi:hypothetical protein